MTKQLRLSASGIPDRNRTWAIEQGLNPIEGHKAGLETLRGIVIPTFLEDPNWKELSLFGFSTKNWKRPTGQVNALMKLFSNQIVGIAEEFNEKGVRIKHAGRKDRLSPELVKRITQAEELTADNEQFQANICIDYDGLDEIRRAVAKAIEAGEPQNFEKHLDIQTPTNLVWMTRKEPRPSGFLTWQSTEAYIHTIDKYMPDVTAEDIRKTIAAYYAVHFKEGK